MPDAQVLTLLLRLGALQAGQVLLQGDLVKLRQKLRADRGIEDADFINQLTFVLDQLEAWVLGKHEHRLNMIMEMLPRAVNLLNTIGARVKQAKVHAAIQTRPKN